MIPTVAVVVLNANRGLETLACLESLYQSDYGRQHIIVVDNHSTDGSVDLIREGYPQVQLVALNRNMGYAGGNNIGIEVALDQNADWVLVLNEDTIVAPDCISQLVGVGESDPRIGLLGPLIYHYNEPQVIQAAGGMLDKSWNLRLAGNNENDRGQFSGLRIVDWLSGCALMARRSLIQSLGAFDERLFMYWEEVDWCLRAHRAGWTLCNVPHAKIWHKGVQRNYQPNPFVTYYSIRNQFFVMKKHRAPLWAWFYQWGNSIRTLVSWSVRPKWRDMREHRDALWQGLFDYARQRWGMRGI